jgi:Pvc16 N-terminal domain
MSNFLAIATVTAVLKRLLQEAADEAVSGAKVGTGRPVADSNGAAAVPGIDLYLYQVTPNPALRNDDLPTQRADGTLVQRPRVAFDLHYLLSFRGDDTKLEPQLLLANAARALHASPVVTRGAIHQALLQNEFSFLAGSDLEQAFELVKITPLALSLEELSKLWSVFFQIPYNLSVAYEATVVVIEGKETPQQALPVLDRGVYVYPFQSAFVEEVASAAGPGSAIRAGDTLVLRGSRLRADVTQLVVRGVVVEPSVVSDTELRVALTSPPFPAGGLRAGIQGVSVAHPLLMGVPPAEHAGFQSNVAAFVLRPEVKAVFAPDSAHVSVTISPAVAKGQRVVLLLNRLPGGPPSAHVFANPPAPADAASVEFEISGVVAGDYFVRVQVDGAESLVDLDPASPQFGPQLTIP